jgi:hypothetical protein
MAVVRAGLHAPAKNKKSSGLQRWSLGGEPELVHAPY